MKKIILFVCLVAALTAPAAVAFADGPPDSWNKLPLYFDYKGQNATITMTTAEKKRDFTFGEFRADLEKKGSGVTGADWNTKTKGLVYEYSVKSKSKKTGKKEITTFVFKAMIDRQDKKTVVAVFLANVFINDLDLTKMLAQAWIQAAARRAMNQ